MTKRRGPRSARQQGEDIGDAIADILSLPVMAVRGLVKWIRRKIKGVSRQQTPEVNVEDTHE